MSTGTPTTAPAARPVPPSGRPMPPANAPAQPQATPQATPQTAPSAPQTAPSAPSQSVNTSPTAPQAQVSVPTGQPVAQTAPPPSGSNGEGEKKPRGRKKLADDPRIFHPALNVDADNKAQNLVTGEPEGYDAKVHFPLRRKDFVDDATFLEYRAKKYEDEAARCRKEAEELRKFGTKESQENARKLSRMVSKMDELAASLAAQGIDVNAFMAKVREEQAEKEAKKATETENKPAEENKAG